MEKVNHPRHYKADGKMECIEEMRLKFGDFHTAIFCLMSAYKYLYRAGKKEGNTEYEDLAKAKWYWQYAGANLFSKVKDMTDYDDLVYILDDFEDLKQTVEADLMERLTRRVEYND